MLIQNSQIAYKFITASNCQMNAAQAPWIKQSKNSLRNWSSLSISVGITFLLSSIAVFLAYAGWPGEVTSNCYEDYLITADCYCERLRGDKPSDIWIAQPINTISNAWFVIAGLVVAYSADSRSFPSKTWWERNNNAITENKAYSTVYALICCLLGIGSTCFHASFTAWGRKLDMLSMYLLAVFLCIYPFQRNGALDRRHALEAYTIMTTLLVYWTAKVANPEETRQLFTAMIVSSYAVEFYQQFTASKQSKQRNRVARIIFISNLVFFLTAKIVWDASQSGGSICDPDSLWQGHSLWHFQSAATMLNQYFYFLAEDHPEEKHIVVIENLPGSQAIASSGSDFSSTDSLSESSCNSEMSAIQ